VDKGLRVRIIGGPGKDDIKDKSRVRGLSKKTLVYDTRKKNDIDFGTEARNNTSNNPAANTYTYAAFNYNKFIPLAYLGYNADEALVLGAGGLYTTYGFQKTPYSSHHAFGVRYASATTAFEFLYDGIFTSALFGMDLQLHLNHRGPRYSRNFFGMGNESEQSTDEKDYNRVRIGQIEIHPELSKTINKNTFSAGLFYQKFSVDSTANRYIADIPANGLNPEIFDTQDYTGIIVDYKYDSRDSKMLPSRGVYFNTSASFNFDLDHSVKTFNRIASDLSVFLSFRKPYRTVLAFRLGGSVNMGDYEFFQASSLGGSTNLRGFRGFPAMPISTRILSFVSSCSIFQPTLPEVNLGLSDSMMLDGSGLKAKIRTVGTMVTVEESGLHLLVWLC